MKRWIGFVSSFYPRSWRDEFGDEFDAVLDDVRPGWRVFANVLKGAVEMRISEGAGWMKLVGATAAVGALAALGMSFMGPQNYRSSAMVIVEPQPDPVRTEAPEARQQRAIAHVNALRVEILSRVELSAIIHDPSLNLYERELKQKQIPLDDVIEQMRRDVRIQVTSSANDASGPIQVNISFLYPDGSKAEAAVTELTNKFVEQDHAMSRMEAEAYQGFWQDMHDYKHAEPAPPPPVAEVVQISMRDPQTHSPPNRFVFLAWGLFVGLLVGLAIRWPRSFFRLAAYAATGFILAAGISFLFPNRFTSTAEMMVSPAVLTEDPHASPPPATPASEFLKQVEPEVLSTEGLGRIVDDPRLNLYSEERKRKSMEEIVGEMRANLRITPADPASGAASAFHISFTYPDRFKAQQTVWSVMTKISEMNQVRQKASQMNFVRHAILARKAGEVLDVLDTANLPTHPDGPPRYAIAMGGLGAGLLLGLVKLRRRRPDPSILVSEYV